MNKKIDEEQLYQAAVKVFGRFGFQRAKMSDVSAALGLASGTIYRYVNDKRDLYLKSIAFGFSRWQIAAKDAAGKFEDPLEKLVVFILSAFGFLQGEKDFLCLLIESPDFLKAYPDDDSVTVINQGSIRNLEEILTAGIESGCFRNVDSEILAEAFFMIYMMFIEKIYFNNEGENAWNMVKFGLEVIIQGVLSRSIDEKRPGMLLSKHESLIVSTNSID